ncbi:MAG: response regulator [candidate division Zixibacteria bacterium]|nr:response regulator [candidate division Zixibacteria bacterium]
MPDKIVTILIADDDPDDRMMIQDAFDENKLANNLVFVENGEELLDYLFNRGDYTDQLKYQPPGLVLLDLNMPKLDGREALKEIKSNASLSQIPVIILTTSQAEEDICSSYSLGVNSFITKPITFDSLVNIIKSLAYYWFQIVELPPALK